MRRSQPLSEDIEDEEDVDDEAGPSSAAGSRAGEVPLLLTCAPSILTSPSADHW